MRPEHITALENICETQDQLQAVWNNARRYNFTKKYEVWVSLCVANDGGEIGQIDKLKWAASVRLANPAKQNFKSVTLWTTHERIKARNILLDLLVDVGSALGEEEFQTTKAMHYNKKLTAEECGIVLKPHLLGN